MGALDVSKGTVKNIYALGAKLGMVERGNGHEDALHALVQGLTGKESITALTPAEAQAVLAELRRRGQLFRRRFRFRQRRCGHQRLRRGRAGSKHQSDAHLCHLGQRGYGSVR